MVFVEYDVPTKDLAGLYTAFIDGDSITLSSKPCDGNQWEMGGHGGGAPHDSNWLEPKGTVL